jgi:DNA-binding response OmpR family regulator
MSFLPIFYYGSPGLEADIFQSYMRCSGYPVKMITERAQSLFTIPDQPSSVAVLALTNSPEELLKFARELCTRSTGSIRRIFILADGQPLTIDDPAVEVIERPFRLSEVIKRIQVLNRQA